MIYRTLLGAAGGSAYDAVKGTGSMNGCFFLSLLENRHTALLSSLSCWGKEMRDSPNRLQPMTKAPDCLTILLKRSIRQIPDF